jgi:predicted permease
LAFTAVFPIFIYLAVGFGARVIGVWNDQTVSGMNKFIYSIIMPIMLFDNTRVLDLGNSPNIGMIVYGNICLAGCFLFGLMFALLTEKDNNRKGVMIQGLLRGSLLIFGIPVIQALQPESGLDDAVLLITATTPALSIFSVLGLEMFKKTKIVWGKVMLNTFLNPLIIGSLLGVLFAVIHPPYPAALASVSSSLSRAAAPLALMVLGGSFTFASVKKYRRQLLLMVPGKLILMPAVWVTGGILLGFRDMPLLCILLLVASPTTVASYTVAHQLGGDAELAGQQVVYSSAFSILTIFLWIILFMSAGLISVG